jgi:hypothetical protein
MSAAPESTARGGRGPALDVLNSALDAHAWRAESFMRAVSHLADGGGTIDAAALAGIAERLEEHVTGIIEAAREASEMLGTGPCQDVVQATEARMGAVLSGTGADA